MEIERGSISIFKICFAINQNTISDSLNLVYRSIDKANVKGFAQY